MTSRAEQHRQLARDFHFMARSLPQGGNRSTLLKMAGERPTIYGRFIDRYHTRTNGLGLSLMLSSSVLDRMMNEVGWRGDSISPLPE
jgi:hypothetical protein